MESQPSVPNPYDGFFLEETVVPHRLQEAVDSYKALTITITGAGEGVGAVEAYRYSTTKLQAKGAAYRVRNLLEAVCRYFNAGGSIEELEPIWQTLKDSFSGVQVMPEGCYLLAQQVDVVNEENVFYNELKDQCWVIYPGVDSSLWDMEAFYHKFRDEL